MGYSQPKRPEVDDILPAFNPKSLIERRPKRSTKSKIAAKLYGKASKGTKSPRPVFFRKHLHVFDYMGKDPPKTFPRSERHLLLSGLLEPISVSAFEHEVREEVLALIHEAELPGVDLSKCESGD